MSQNKSEQHSRAGKASAARMTPEQRRERARKAGQAGNNLDAYVRRVVSRAPELTPAQREQLAAILRSGSAPAGRTSSVQVTADGGAR